MALLIACVLVFGIVSTGAAAPVHDVQFTETASDFSSESNPLGASSTSENPSQSPGGSGGGGAGGGDTPGGGSSGGSGPTDPTPPPPPGPGGPGIPPYPEEPEFPFTDVVETGPYYEAVRYVWEHEIMNGTTETLFSPEATVIRPMFVYCLYRMENEPLVSGEIPFSDVVSGTYYTNAVIWASETGIIGNYFEDLFGVRDNITLEWTMTVIYGYARFKGLDISAAADLSGYPYAGEISGWALDAMKWAIAEEFIPADPNPGAIGPKSEITRAQMAVLIYRYLTSELNRAGGDITDDFVDPMFRAMVYEEIRKTPPMRIYKSDVANIVTLYVSYCGIRSLEGLEWFVSLKNLSCHNNYLKSLPGLPTGLYSLSCENNQIEALPNLPAGIVYLWCRDNRLTSLPKLPSSLNSVYCTNNQLTSLPKLPDGLRYLQCGNNQLTELPPLPDDLQSLSCSDNQLTSLPELPDGLESLWCDDNQLASLPELPSSLRAISCNDNLLTMLDVTGLQLYYLSCCNNYMPDTSAVIGFDGEWDDEDFAFYPQRTVPVTYTITATAGTGGSISPSGSVTVPEGESQTFTITPDKDYEIASVTVDGSNVGSTPTFTFENVTGPHTIAAAFTSTTKAVNPDTTGKTSSQDSGKAAEDISVVDIFNPKTPLDPEPDFPFEDVLLSQWFYEDAVFVWEQGLMNGTSDAAFSPSGSLTRGMVVTVLYRIGGEPDVSDVDMPFTDVSAVWYYDAIKWAADEGIALGFDDGTFRPGDSVTREQMAAFISRFAICNDIEIPASVVFSSFADQADISEWAIDAVKELFMADIVKGKDDNRFDPKGFANRAEFAAVLHRFLMAVS